MAEGAETASAYASAGVDIAAGDRAVALMKEHVARAGRPEVVSDSSGFAGLFRLDAAKKYRSPLLAASTDGVGTKATIAQRCDRHDTLGRDLVGMVVDDLVVSGAEPLFMTDYIACGKVVPERIADLVAGIAEGCRLAGCALVGGETAEHPGTMRSDEYDLAGAGTGIVEEDEVLGPHRVRTGDAVIAMASSGLHSNGYSLVRRIIDEAGMRLDARVPELGAELGEELLRPTRIYAGDCLALAAETEVHAFSHITGGGLAANLARSLPEDHDAVVDRSTWTPPAVFPFIAERGSVPQADMEAAFNMGVGMTAVVPAASAEAALAVLAERGVPAWKAGSVVAGTGQARLEGAHT
ncbi:phosphoribosylformylglycinamidine cyclo-ligase [Streptomonospora salina]|uniref:Phosphoribosylformylglycinamidine cyclo-ligase n=1 Tax=Streptomonospora salina TaxID=104205 RepID=A0A841E859_9ACTN|nr:phosphoribosylformylglycinamidine cyclo-ligase [Streptomonospora salina]MBB5999082.1 phosphoribosylformylglycinamidine cyclo-ligase [Streptomonospora salina]